MSHASNCKTLKSPTISSVGEGSEKLNILSTAGITINLSNFGKGFGNIKMCVCNEHAISSLSLYIKETLTHLYKNTWIWTFLVVLFVWRFCSS